jgi:small subunit ribosomal protein S17
MQEEQNQNLNQSNESDPLNLNAGIATEAQPESGDQAEGISVGRRKSRIGLVVSNKMDKSITVAVVRRVRHPLYKKYFNKTKKYMAHDELNECGVGDRVRIVETRPLSARKRWRVDVILEKAK